MDSFNVFYTVAHCIDQGCAACRKIIAFLHISDLFEIDSVIDHFAVVVEEHTGDQAITFDCLLFLQHGIESSDTVLFQSGHRSAPVKDKYEFSKIFLHFFFPPLKCDRISTITS